MLYRAAGRQIVPYAAGSPGSHARTTLKEVAGGRRGLDHCYFLPERHVSRVGIPCDCRVCSDVESVDQGGCLQVA